MQVSDVSVPVPEQTGLWGHQQDGQDFTERLWNVLGLPGVLLAMAMGTGKTMLAIRLMERLHATLVLIVCPMRVVDVWKRELEKHARLPYVACFLDDRAGSVQDKTRLARQKLAQAQAHRLPCLIVINYESAWREPFAHFALGQFWSLIVADEIHRLKTTGGRLSRFMARVAKRAMKRLGLSGTPIAHSILDVYGEFLFLDPRIYQETYNDFKLAYARWGGFDRRQPVAWINQDDFRQRFHSITYRVTKEQALPYLPEQIDQDLYCDLTPKGRARYDQLEAEFLTWLGETPEDLLTVASAMVLLLRLQQLTGGTLKDDQGREHAVDASKENLLADFLLDLDEAEPVVAFAYFHADLDAVRRASIRAGRCYSELSGRKNELRQWHAHKGGILGAQIVSAAEGIDLTRAHIAVFYSTGWRLYTYLQARDRLHRPGQKFAVNYYHLFARDTVDEIVSRAIHNRWQFAETVLQEMSPHAKRCLSDVRTGPGNSR